MLLAVDNELLQNMMQLFGNVSLSAKEVIDFVHAWLALSPSFFNKLFNSEFNLVFTR